MLLQKVLWTNAVFSLLCGLLLLIFPKVISVWLGTVPPWLLILLALGLLVFALDVFWIAGKLPQAKVRAQIIFWADIGWVAMTPVALWFFASYFTTVGMFIVLDIALIVAVFALLEWKGLQQLTLRFA